MDLDAIAMTLALLGSGAALPACDGDKKAASEVEGKKADAKADAKAGAEAKAGEHACGAEGACGEGACGEGACGGGANVEAGKAEEVPADAEAKADGGAADAEAKDKS